MRLSLRIYLIFFFYFFFFFIFGLTVAVPKAAGQVAVC